ncbi:hypothetical protein CRUP_037055, partial [Coryphaenoides rupestris]
WLTSAVLSLQTVYPRRNLPADQWRRAQLFSLFNAPAAMLDPVHCDTVSCEYLSMEVMERWIIICFLLCPTSVNTHQPSLELWRTALQSGLYLTLIRGEVLNIHKVSEEVYDSLKGGALHRQRRGFLRGALKELFNILEDEPGLLGPKQVGRTPLLHGEAEGSGAKHIYVIQRYHVQYLAQFDAHGAQDTIQ